MPVWQILLDAMGVLLILPIACGVALIVRRRLLTRHGGTLELSYRIRSAHQGRGWLLGIGRYRGDALEWYRIFSLSMRPKRVWGRSTLAYVGRRDQVGAEELSLYSGHVIVECRDAGEPLELAMSQASLTGFQSWLESGPPGADWDRR